MKELENALLSRLIYALMEEGLTDLQNIQSRFLVILQDFKIEPKEEALTVYTEGKNDFFLRQFLISKTVAGCSKRTIAYYGSENRKLLDAIGKDADTITPQDLQVRIAQRMRSGVSNVTINSERRAASSFFAWMAEQDYISKNPMLRVDKLKEIKEKKKAFTEYEVEKLRDACRSKREKAIIEILLSTGCRVSELVSIKIDDLQPDKVNILGKGSKRRDVFLNARALVSIENYLKERKDSNPYLFPKGVCITENKGHLKGNGQWYTDPSLIDSGPMATSSIESIIRKIGKRAGVENAHPHRFRRTCATMALRRGMKIEMVSKMLGHESIETTQIYLDILESELAEMHKKYVV